MCVCFRYMLMGGAVDLWMLHVGRFLTGVASGMTAASIPVGYHDERNFVLTSATFLNFFWINTVFM